VVYGKPGFMAILLGPGWKPRFFF